MGRIGIASALLVAYLATPTWAQPPAPTYLVIGDSVEFGLGDDTAADGFGYVPLVAEFLAAFLGQPVDLHNFGEPFAQTRQIWREQLPEVLAAAPGGATAGISTGSLSRSMVASSTSGGRSTKTATCSTFWCSRAVTSGLRCGSFAKILKKQGRLPPTDH